MKKSINYLIIILLGLSILSGLFSCSNSSKNQSINIDTLRYDSTVTKAYSKDSSIKPSAYVYYVDTKEVTINNINQENNNKNLLFFFIVLQCIIIIFLIIIIVLLYYKELFKFKIHL